MPTAAINPTLIVYGQLWTIALAHPGLVQVLPGRPVPLLKSGNVERFDLPTVRNPKVKQALQSADSVTFALDIGSGRPDQRAPRTLCLQPAVDNVDFTWTLTVPTAQILDVTQAEAELRAAMVAAGTQLGIPAVVARWEWARRPGTAQRPAQAGKDRVVTVTQTITIKG
jgi:hypothetical protein